MTRQRAGTAVLSGLAALPLLVAGSNLLVLPAAVVGIGGILLGIGGLRRSSDAATTPLGVALLVAAVVAVVSVMSGDALLAASGVVATGLLSLVWMRLLRHRKAEHAVWAERFGRTLERDRELGRRRDARFTQPPEGG